MAEETGRKDTELELVISWLKEDLEYYKNNIGEIKDYGYTKRVNFVCTTCGSKAKSKMAKSVTKITQKLVDATKLRIEQLEDKL